MLSSDHLNHIGAISSNPFAIILLLLLFLIPDICTGSDSGHAWIYEKVSICLTARDNLNNRTGFTNILSVSPLGNRCSR